jgi:hypothetical protein
MKGMTKGGGERRENSKRKITMKWTTKTKNMVV